MKTSFNNWSSLEKYFSDIIILQIDDVIFEWLHISNEKRKKKLRIRLRLNQFSTEKFERRKLKWIKKTSWNSNKNKIRLQQTIKIHFLLSVSSAVSYKKSQYFKSFFFFTFSIIIYCLLTRRSERNSFPMISICPLWAVHIKTLCRFMKILLWNGERKKIRKSIWEIKVFVLPAPLRLQMDFNLITRRTCNSRKIYELILELELLVHKRLEFIASLALTKN